MIFVIVGERNDDFDKRVVNAGNEDPDTEVLDTELCFS